MNRLRPGAKGEFSAIVEDIHTASAMGNTGVNVLATPAVAWLFEGAASDALMPVMEEGEISVGTMILVRHLKPTPLRRRPSWTVRRAGPYDRRRGSPISRKESTVVVRTNRPVVRCGTGRNLLRW